MMDDDEVAGLRCTQVLAALSDYLDGELSVEARARVEAHLRGCPNCARFGGTIGRIVARLRGPEPDDDLVLARLRARLDLD